MGEARYTAEQIAQWFINRSVKDFNDEKGDLLSNLKLQKLMYYAQGASLALTNEPLFDEPIFAWNHGPVVQSIYYKYKGNFGIDSLADVDIDRKTANILESVYQIFGQYSAWKLRDMTHEETPWKETKQSAVIPTHKIKEYFLKHYVSQK